MARRVWPVARRLVVAKVVLRRLELRPAKASEVQIRLAGLKYWLRPEKVVLKVLVPALVALVLAGPVDYWALVKRIVARQLLK